MVEAMGDDQHILIWLLSGSREVNLKLYEIAIDWSAIHGTLADFQRL